MRLITLILTAALSLGLAGASFAQGEGGGGPAGNRSNAGGGNTSSGGGGGSGR